MPLADSQKKAKKKPITELNTFLIVFFIRYL